MNKPTEKTRPRPLRMPLKQARCMPASNTGRELIAAAHYVELTLLANDFGSVFWFFEQRRCQMADRIENEIGHK